MSELKSFLYSFLGKKKLTPDYDIRNSGPKHRQRFLCEVRVPTYSYVGIGNSTSKKDSQANAAKDFLNFLVRSGELNSKDVPLLDAPVASMSNEGPSSLPPGMSAPHQAFGMGGGPGDMGGGGGGEHGGRDSHDGSMPSYQRSFFERQGDKRKLEEAEGADMNAGIHGNWTISNAKSRLHQFLQTNRIQADYKYTPVGQDHNRSFYAEMSIYLASKRRTIHAREQGSNKKTASVSCALSLTRQLYHLKEIEAFTGERKAKKADSEIMDMVSQLGDKGNNIRVLPKERSFVASWGSFDIVRAELETPTLNMGVSSGIADSKKMQGGRRSKEGQTKLVRELKNVPYKDRLKELNYSPAVQEKRRHDCTS
nr:dosage compensation regulator-like [Lytechinus pictus]